MIAKVEHYQHFNASYLSKMILRVININLVYCILNNKNVGLHHSDILVRPRKPIWMTYSDNNILHLNSILTVPAFCHLGLVGEGSWKIQKDRGAHLVTECPGKFLGWRAVNQGEHTCIWFWVIFCFLFPPNQECMADMFPIIGA